jgi:hypothetical protein
MRSACERRCARGPGVGEEESGAVLEMVVAGEGSCVCDEECMQRAPRPGMVLHIQLQCAEDRR